MPTGFPLSQNGDYHCSRNRNLKRCIHLSVAALQGQGTAKLHVARANFEVGAIFLSITWWTQDGYEYLGQFEFGAQIRVCRVCFVKLVVMISEGHGHTPYAGADADADADELRHQETRPLRRR